MKLRVLAIILFVSSAVAQDWKILFNGKNLDGWETKGDGSWKVLSDGTLIGTSVSGPANPFGPQWPVTITQQQYRDWRQTQSWLYTVDEFGEYDLHAEYLTPLGGNSGITIRDNTRGKYSYGPTPDFNKTPAHFGYEIQIINGVKTKYPTGSIYLFAPAVFGHERENDWNSIDIASRNDSISVKLNGHDVASHPGEAGRPKVGPIGLQLHDRFSVIMFRNIKIRPIK